MSMDKTEALTAQARKMTAARTTPQLVADWIESDAQITAATTAEERTYLGMARGWIMDELEVRDAEAFAAWVETPEMDNESLAKLYGVAA
jgi:hypothetical protein